MSEKTEEPSPKRLRKAREQGDVPVSAALVSASAFLVSLSLVPAAAKATSGWVSSALRDVLSSAEPRAMPSFADVATAVLTLAAPVLLASAAVAVLVGAVQAGGVIATEKLVPDLSRLSPAKGIASLFSTQRLVAILRALVAMIAVVILARNLLRDHVVDLATTLGSPGKAGIVAGELARVLARDVALVLLAAAFVDLVLTRRAWRERLMMTRAEVKQEHKESEGDPQLKAARERAHHELLAQAAVHAVKTATVVIVNPTHLATALEYGEDDGAPKVVSKGDGVLAQKIVEAARDYGIPIVQDIPLARALQALEVGDEIPESLYEAVAEILRALWDAEEAADSETPPEG